MSHRRHENKYFKSFFMFIILPDLFLVKFLDIIKSREHRLYILAVDLAVYIVFGDLHNRAAQGNYSNKVRDSHHSVEGI